MERNKHVNLNSVHFHAFGIKLQGKTSQPVKFDFLFLAPFQKLRNFPKSQRERDDTSLSYI